MIPESHVMLQTISVATAAGVVLILVARRLRVSAIVFLFIGGIVLGPEALGLVRPSVLGTGLTTLVSIAVALILFEGGLTLDFEGYRGASGVIRRLLTVGVLVTWLATAMAIVLLFRFPLEKALLAASLVVVTGPTVISPILRRIRLQPNLHHILHWESVLIDPVGAFLAILCYQYLLPEVETQAALAQFALRFAVGAGFGCTAGLAMDFALRRRWVPDDLVNVATLGAALLTFELCDVVLIESGLLGAATAGLVLGLRRPAPIERIRRFKTELTDLLVGMLFILLAANLRLAQFAAFGWRGLALLGIIIFVVRPLNIVASTFGSGLSWREKLFLSWMCPRGIVAASMAALFSLTLVKAGGPEYVFLEVFTFSVIAVTILLQGLTAGTVARFLNLQRPARTGWLIVGAHPLSRGLAHFIREEASTACVLTDKNPRLVSEAHADGLDAICEDALGPDLPDHDELAGVGNVLALTDNEDYNVLACNCWATVVGHHHVFRWSPDIARHGQRHQNAGESIWDALPRPSILGADLHEEHAELLRVSPQDPTLAESETMPLAVARKGSVVLKPDLPESPSPPGTILVLRREMARLARSVRPELVVRLRVNTVAELFTVLADQMVAIEPRLPKRETVHELFEREKGFPTALGHGVAVPHTYSTALTQPLCAIAQVPNGLDFRALDNLPVRLFYLLVSPSGDPEGHLATLGEIARLCSDVKLRARLMSADVPGELLEIIKGWRPHRMIRQE